MNNAVQAIVATHPDPTLSSVPVALMVCATYVAVALGAAGLLITRRDA